MVWCHEFCGGRHVTAPFDEKDKFTSGKEPPNSTPAFKELRLLNNSSGINFYIHGAIKNSVSMQERLDSMHSMKWLSSFLCYLLSATSYGLISDHLSRLSLGLGLGLYARHMQATPVLIRK